MEVDICHRDAVGMALRLGDEIINCQDVFLYRLRNTKVIPDKMGDVPHPSVVVGMFMIMSMIVLVIMAVAVVMVVLVAVSIDMIQALFLLPVHSDGDMGARNAAFDGLLPGYPDARQAQIEVPAGPPPAYPRRRPCRSPDTESS